MDNLKTLVIKIQKFYALVELHENQIQDCIKEAKKPLNSLINQSAIYRATISENTAHIKAFDHLEGFRESLIEVIVASLEEEVLYLEDVRSKIDVANEALLKDQESIENLYLSLKSKNLIDVSELNPCCPALEHIIDWCFDVWSFYHSFYLQISQGIFNINFESEDSVTNLFRSFKENSELKKHINKIRSFNFSKFEFLNESN